MMSFSAFHDDSQSSAGDTSTFQDVNRTKALTCYYWANYEKCKFDDAVCGYAHYDTGRVAEKPVQVEPGSKRFWILFDHPKLTV